MEQNVSFVFSLISLTFFSREEGGKNLKRTIVGFCLLVGWCFFLGYKVVWFCDNNLLVNTVSIELSRLGDIGVVQSELMHAHGL